MKTLKILGMTLCLNGCIYAGEFNFLPWRSDFIAGWSGYAVTYLDDSQERLLTTENLQESSFTANKLLTAYKGYPVADTKNYSKNYYVQESLIAPQDAMVSTGGTPAQIVRNQKYDVIGKSTIDGQVFYLVDSGNSSFVFLVDEEYKLQKHLGTVRGDRLVLADDIFVLSPEDFRFEPVTKSRVLQSDMVKGFEIKFEGVQNGMMLFTLLQYDAGGATGEFTNYNFDNQPGIVKIAGVKIKVFSAEDSRIEYMILAE